MVKMDGHDLAKLFNAGYSLEQIANNIDEDLKPPAIRARIERAGYEMIKQYQLRPRAEIKARFESVLKKKGKKQ